MCQCATWHELSLLRHSAEARRSCPAVGRVSGRVNERLLSAVVWGSVLLLRFGCVTAIDPAPRSTREWKGGAGACVGTPCEGTGRSSTSPPQAQCCRTASSALCCCHRAKGCPPRATCSALRDRQAKNIVCFKLSTADCEK